MQTIRSSIQYLSSLPIWLTASGGMTLLLASQFRSPDGTVDIVCLNIGGISLIACLLLSELRRRKRDKEIRELREAATTDSLTQVGNRRAFDLELSRRLALYRRHRTSCSLLFIDADQFKSINDRWGHDIGDLALKVLAKAICATLRDIDLLYRFGGDEFVALLPETRAEEAAIAGERIRQSISQIKIRSGSQTLEFTASIGCTELLATDSSESWLKRADDALHFAKNSGRNRIEIGMTDQPHFQGPDCFRFELHKPTAAGGSCSE